MADLGCCRGDNMEEVYHGWRCRVCGTEYPWGCEPWVDADDDTPCPHCGEEGCERSCTGAILADEQEGATAVAALMAQLTRAMGDTL